MLDRGIIETRVGHDRPGYCGRDDTTSDLVGVLQFGEKTRRHLCQSPLPHVGHPRCFVLPADYPTFQTWTTDLSLSTSGSNI